MDSEDFGIWFDLFKAAISGGVSGFPDDIAVQSAAVADAGLIEARKRLPHS